MSKHWDHSARELVGLSSNNFENNAETNSCYLIAKLVNISRQTFVFF